MDTVQGDKFVIDCARWIRYNEARLGDVAGTSSSLSGSIGSWMNPTTWMLAGGIASSPSQTTPQSNHAQRLGGRTRTMSTLASSSSQPPRPVATLHRPLSFRITNHHLYYLLIRCEALNLPIGPLDVRIPAKSRPSSYFAFISNNAAGATYRKRDKEETMSISSLQTTMSAFGLGGSKTSSGSWWSSEKHDIIADIRYIYSAMTKLPALRIGPPPLKLIRDFEDCPGEMSVPMDAFKNVQILEFEDADPRAFLGWDRLSVQLRSLSMKRSGVEDVSDIVIDAVLNDGKRRRGEKVKPRKRKVHGLDTNDGSDGMQTSNDTSVDTSAAVSEAEQVEAQEPLPSLSWHFLRHLCLSDNSLTFVHHSAISYLNNLTSLDLSHNLLNAVPPSLNALTKLRSLNMSNNLIDSVLGIPDSIPNIEALNLSHNRLESLCGLERLAKLSRVDLRSNEVFEAGEVGRLATLEEIREVFVAGNPLMEEEEDPRVLVFSEFAKEGRVLDQLKLDGESVGFFERQRVRELVPNMDRLVKAHSKSPIGSNNNTRNDTPMASELAKLAKTHQNDPETSDSSPIKHEEEAQATKASVIVKNVRHRGAAGHGKKASHSSLSANGKSGSQTLQQGEPSSSRIVGPTPTGSRVSAAQRRNRRIVELADSMHEDEDDQGRVVKEEPISKPLQDEASDSDLIKRAALAGNTEIALGSVFVRTDGNREANDHKTEEKANGSNSKLNADATDVNKKVNRTTKDDSGKGDGIDENPSKMKRGSKLSATKQVQTQNGEGDGSSTSQELRRKIEALKGEVGDDWMRLLARGESTS